MSIYNRLTGKREEDEEEFLTPSQRAREEQKGDSIYSRLTTKPVEKKVEEEKKPSPLQRISTKVKDFFTRFDSGREELEKKKREVEEVEIQEFVEPIGKGMNLFDFIAKEAAKSAQLSPEGLFRYSAEGQKQVREKGRKEVEAVTRTELEPGYVEPGTLGGAVESLKQSTVSLISSLGAGTEMVGQMTNHIVLTEVGQKVKLEADKVLASHPEWSPPKDQKWGKEKVARLVAASAPSLLGAVGAGIVAGPTGLFAYGVIMEGGSTYGEAIDAGTPEGKAQIYGSVVGIINGTIESIFPNELLSAPARTAKKKITKSIVNSVMDGMVIFGKKFIKGGVQEGSEEFLQQLVSNTVAKNYDENRSLWDEVAESFVGGALTGGLVQQFEGKVTYPSGRKIEMDAKDFKDSVIGSDLRDTETGNKMLKIADKAEKEGKRVSIDMEGKDGVKVVTPAGNTVGIETIKTEVKVEEKPPVVTEKKEEKPVEPVKPTKKGEVVIKPKEITKEMKPLIKEARKYKSAKEFVKAQRTPATAETADLVVSPDLFKVGQANPIEENKVTKFVEDMAGEWGDFPPVSGRKTTIDKDDFAEYLKAVEGGYENELRYSRELTKADIGKEIIEIENGHHRALAAKEIGINIPVVDMDLQEQVAQFSTKQLTDIYNQAKAKPKVKVKVKKKKPSVKPKPKPKKGVTTVAEAKKAVAKAVSVEKQRQVVKRKKFEAKKVKDIKAVTFPLKERKQIQSEIKEIVSVEKNQKSVIADLNSYIDSVNQDADNPLYNRKLKAIRAELKRSMYELVDVDTGNWKRDYAYFQTLRQNPRYSDLVDSMEEQIYEIDDKVTPNSPAGPGFATTGAEIIDKFENRAEPKKGSHEFKLYKRITGLIRKYAQSIGEGYTPRGALGVYYGKTKNIRVNAINDLSVAAHEITHFLDSTYKISDVLMAVKGLSINGKPIYNQSTLKYRKAITDLYVKYYPTGRKTHKLRKRMREGFATLLQKYVESPTKIAAEFPLLVDSFLKEGGVFYKPIMGKILTDLNNIVKDYQGLSSLDKIGARVTSEATGINKESFLSFGDRVRTQIADRLYPIEVLAKKAGVDFTVKDPRLWLEAYNSVSGIINNNIATNKGYWTLRNEEYKKVSKNNWKTLVDLVEQRKNTDDFAFYLVARREYFAYEELDNLKKDFKPVEVEFKEALGAKEDPTRIVREDGTTLAEEYYYLKGQVESLSLILDKDGLARGEIDSAFGENEERFKEESAMFDKLTKFDLQFLLEVQLITPKQYSELTSKEGYASFKRQFYDEIVGDKNEIPGVVKVGGTKVSSLIKRKGSQRTIINPLYSGIANHSEVMRKGLKQVVYNKIADIGRSAAFPNLFQKLQVKSYVDKDSGAIIFPQDKDPNIIMGRKNFKRSPVLVDQQIKTILDDLLTWQNVGIFEKVYTGLSRLFTAGTTGWYPKFAATNIVVDQITAAVNTSNKYKPIYSIVSEFGKVLKDKQSREYKYYEEYMVLGGERQTFTGWQALPPAQLFKRIKGEKTGLNKAIRLVDKGVDIFSTPSKYSEIVSRASEYIKARKAGKAQIVAMEEAGRVTAPFHHMGKWGSNFGKTIVRGLPFFNASLQVIDQSLKTLETKAGRQRSATMLAVITSAYLASLLNLMRADDDQIEQYKDLQPRDLVSFLYSPHPSGKGLFKVKMSPQFSAFGTILNMIIADEVLQTRYKKKDYISAATSVIPDQFNPLDPVRAFFSWVPQVFSAGFETLVGVRTYPEVSPLESMSLKNTSKGLRTNENTSRFAKWLGKQTNLSPIKIDYLLTGYFGRSIGFLTGQPSAWELKSSVVRDYWFSSARRVSGAYDLREENDTKYSDYQKGLIEVEDPAEIYRTKILTNNFAEAMSDYRDIDIEENQEKATEARNEVLKIIEQIENGDKPKGYSKWVRGAKKRRRIEIRERKKLQSDSNLFPSTQKKARLSLVKKAFAAENIHGQKVYDLDLRTGIQKAFDWIAGLFKGGEKIEEPPKNLQMTDQQRYFYKVAQELRAEYPEWYKENIGSEGERNMFNGADLNTDNLSVADIRKAEGVTVNEPEKYKKPTITKKPKTFNKEETKDYDNRIKEEFEKYGEDGEVFLRILEEENKGRIIRRSEENKWKDYNYKPDADGVVRDYSVNNREWINHDLLSKEEWSEDRGLCRINNETFYTYLGGVVKRQEMFEAGIIPEEHLAWEGLTPEKVEEYWEFMYDPDLNYKMARLIFKWQGPDAWVAAPKDLLSEERKRQLGKS